MTFYQKKIDIIPLVAKALFILKQDGIMLSTFKLFRTRSIATNMAYLALMLHAGFVCPGDAQAQESPSLGGVECYDPNSPTAGWASSLDIVYELHGESNIPIWLDLDEDAEFKSPTTYDYRNQLPIVDEILPEFDTGQVPLDLSDDGKKLLAGHKKGEVLLIDLETHEEIRRFLGAYNEAFVMSVALSQDGSKAVASGLDGITILWDVETAQIIRTFTEESRYANSVAFSPDGTRLFTGNSSFASIWDVATGQRLHRLSGAGDFKTFAGVLSSAFSPDGTKVAIGTEDHKAVVWDVETGARVGRYDGHTYWINSVNFSSDGSKLLTGSYDKTIILWDVATGAKIKKINENKGYIQKTVLSKDETEIISVSYAESECILHVTTWDILSGSEIRSFSMETRSVRDVDFNNDRSEMLLGSRHNAAYKFDLRSLFSYSLDEGPDGLRTIYARLRNETGQSGTLSTTINLDSTGPEPPGKPVWHDSTDSFTWTASGDPAPGSGVAGYECQIGTWPGESDIFYENIGDTLSHVLIGVEAPFYCHVRAIDFAGNIGDWSLYNNTPPSTPVVSISPVNPRTHDVVCANATSVDEENNSISYQYEWLRDGHIEAYGPSLDPSLTLKNQHWECRVKAIDGQGAYSQHGSQSFVIINSLPTQPVVEILPDPYENGKDLVVDAQIYSLDPDGDEVGYDFKWYKSTDEGKNWIHKAELDGSSSVSATYIRNNELWRVEYTPYEKNFDQQPLVKSTGVEMQEARVEGVFAMDQIFTGLNNSPEVTFISVEGRIGNGLDAINVEWVVTDADDDLMTIDLFWTDKMGTGFVLLASDIPGTQQFVQVNTDLPSNRLIYLYAEVTDDKGSISHIISGALKMTIQENAVKDWLLYL